MIEENDLRLMLIAELEKPLYNLKFQAIKAGFHSYRYRKSYYVGYCQAIEDVKKEMDKHAKGGIQ
jgi:hypothetical protein